MTKCWCGKELKIGRGQPTPAAVTDHPIWVCPDCGADCVWRKCPEYAGAVAGHYRQCKVHCSSEGSIAAVPAYVCANCSVPERVIKSDLWDACGPALVEALRECIPILDACATIIESETDRHSDDQDGCQACKAREHTQTLQAALALVPEGRG